MNNYVVVCKILYMVKVLDHLGNGRDCLTKFLYSLLIHLLSTCYLVCYLTRYYNCQLGVSNGCSEVVVPKAKHEWMDKLSSKVPHCYDNRNVVATKGQTTGNYGPG